MDSPDHCLPRPQSGVSITSSLKWILLSPSQTRPISALYKHCLFLEQTSLLNPKQREHSQLNDSSSSNFLRSNDLAVPHSFSSQNLHHSCPQNQTLQKLFWTHFFPISHIKSATKSDDLPLKYPFIFSFPLYFHCGCLNTGLHFQIPDR